MPGVVSSGSDALDPVSWAERLGISREAVELYLASEVIDLHVDSLIWQRMLGYDVSAEHANRIGMFLGQVDLPRLREAHIGGATWVITTNPLRDAPDRVETFESNARRLVEQLERCADRVRLAKDTLEYRAARDAGLHAAFVGIQGGNALDPEARVLDRVPAELVVRVTLMHLTPSALGSTSTPIPLVADRGLTRPGETLVRALESRRVLVDLAHASPRTFWGAVQAHDPALPLLVSHTGVSGVHDHWRNLDDAQLRAIADSGGTVGVLYHVPFLGDPWYAGRVATVARHIEHIVRTVGDDFASLGSDWDGAIIAPRDMPTCLELPRLVQALLDLGVASDSVRKILGENFLRVVRAIRR